jgi:hypothetical protein
VVKLTGDVPYIKSIISRSGLQHNYSKDIKKLNRQIISNSVKRKAIEETAEKPFKIIHSVLKNHTRSEQMTTVSVRDICYIRNNLYKSHNVAWYLRSADGMRNPTCKKDRKSSNGFIYSGSFPTTSHNFTAHPFLKYSCPRTAAILWQGNSNHYVY